MDLLVKPINGTGKEEYFGTFPVPEAQVIQYAINTGKKGVGIDCMSVDPMNIDPTKEEMPNHFMLFRAGKVIVENLCNLDQASGKMVDFFALPLKYRDADGAPVRAIAILSE